MTLLLILLLLQPGEAVPADGRAEAERLFALGLTLVAERDTAGAIAAFEGARATGWRSAAVEHNLGSLALASGRIGAARLHLERAARLAPLDADVQKNLRLAREAAGVAPPGAAERVWRAVVSGAGPLGVVAAAALLWLTWAVLAWRRALGRVPLAALGAFALVAALGGFVAVWEEAHPTAITVSDTEVRASPSASAPTEGSLAEGQRVSAGPLDGGWSYVRARGVHGWVPGGTVARL
jgi:tetratricopeptide (TPR) repeat protein